MFNRINDLAYNQRLSILAIHFILCLRLKNLFKSIAYKLRPIIPISGHKGHCRFFGLCPAYFRFAINALADRFAKLSTSVGMGTYKHLRINPPCMELLNG